MICGLLGGGELTFDLGLDYGFEYIRLEMTASLGSWYEIDLLEVIPPDTLTTISALELSYLDGASSNIQTQLNDVKKTNIIFAIDGGGNAITTGAKHFVTVPFDCTITGWTILADVSGSIVIDVWKDTYANHIPTVADSIAGSEKPTITTATKGQDLTLTTWTSVTVTAGDIIRFNVDSATTVTLVHLAIHVTKT